MASTPLSEECRAYTLYLVGCEPSDYVLEKYEACHLLPNMPLFAPPRTFESFLLRASRWGRPATRLADAYARWFAPKSALRSKLILLLAILELRTPFATRLDRVDSGGLAVLLVRLPISLVAGALLLGMATVTLGPCHLVLRAFSAAPRGRCVSRAHTEAVPLPIVPAERGRA